MIEKINKLLQQTKLIECGRACDLLWFSFLKGNKGVQLHSQCFARIVFNGEIITTSSEIYHAYNEEEDDDNFEWDRPGKSIYDVKLKNFLQSNLSFNFDRFESKGLGDYTVYFDNGLEIQLFVNNSVDYESWRVFILKGKSKHFVSRNVITKE
jgi:hypothetical protein